MEIALHTRSISQLINALAAQVEVPAQDLAEHNDFPGWESAPGTTDDLRMIRIHSSKRCPPNAFVAVPYNGYWFWIDKGDLKSKRTFSFIMALYTLADASEKPPLPEITIPAH